MFNPKKPETCPTCGEMNGQHIPDLHPKIIDVSQIEPREKPMTPLTPRDALNEASELLDKFSTIFQHAEKPQCRKEAEEMADKLDETLAALDSTTPWDRFMAAAITKIPVGLTQEAGIAWAKKVADLAMKVRPK